MGTQRSTHPPLRILFVENNATFATTVTSAFLSDCEVTIVGSIQGAIAHLNEDDFEVLLVDYDLDDGKGTTVASHAQSSGFGGRIIAVSSHDEGNKALLAAGATAVCRKADFGRLRGVLAGR